MFALLSMASCVLRADLQFDTTVYDNNANWLLVRTSASVLTALAATDETSDPVRGMSNAKFCVYNLGSVAPKQGSLPLSGASS